LDADTDSEWRRDTDSEWDVDGTDSNWDDSGGGRGLRGDAQGGGADQHVVKTTT